MALGDVGVLLQGIFGTGIGIRFQLSSKDILLRLAANKAGFPLFSQKF
jgi:hypothetical protein